MKIFYYLPSLYTSGGLERIIMLKANYFADHLGHDITILTSEQKGRLPYYKLSGKVKLIDLGIVIDTRYKRFSFRKLTSYPFKYYRFKKRFSAVLYQYRPDIVISTLRRELNFICSVGDGSIKIGEFHVTRYAYHAGSVHENNYLLKVIKKYWGNHFVAKLKKLARLVLLTEEEVLNWPELSNTVVIPNPLSLFPEKVSACENKQVIAVGRHSYQKGFDLLADAWTIVHDRHPDWLLKIYGEGEKAPLLRQIKDNKLEGSCILENPVKNIDDKYTESSIFVLSSRFEGFGMVIAEAMACGVPPVSFACPCGPKDIIKDGTDGLLVRPGDIPGLADKICFLIENREIRKEMGKNARKNIERLKFENVAQRWERLFNELKKNRIVVPEPEK